jgi:hypothetical protein
METSLRHLIIFAFAAAISSAFGQSRTELPNYPDLPLQEQSVWLLDYRGVKSSLGLTDAEQQGVDRANKSYSNGQVRMAARNVAATDAQNEALDRSFAHAVLQALTPVHRERLLEILLQVKGAEALEDANVAKEVGVTPDQKSHLHVVLEAANTREENFNAALTKKVLMLPRIAPASLYEKKRLAAIQAAEPLREALARQRTADENKVIGSLTPPQRRRWDKLLGTPFPLARYRN